MRQYIAFVLRRRILVVALVAALTVLAGGVISQGTIGSSLVRLFFGENAQDPPILEKIESSRNNADPFTKQLNPDDHERHREGNGVRGKNDIYLNKQKKVVASFTIGSSATCAPGSPSPATIGRGEGDPGAPSPATIGCGEGVPGNPSPATIGRGEDPGSGPATIGRGEAPGGFVPSPVTRMFACAGRKRKKGSAAAS